MKIISMGSFNRDMVYQVDHIAAPGETIAAHTVENHWGGKGLNQAMALSRAYHDVHMVGAVNHSDAQVCQLLADNNINHQHVALSDQPTGHAIICVDREGQNSITFFHGSNYSFTADGVRDTLATFDRGDILLLQNEINCMADIMVTAKELGLKIALNPSPFEDSLLQLPLDAVSWFLINETEGYQLTGEKEPQRIAEVVASRWPEAAVVLTLGGDGVYYRHGDTILTQNAYKVTAVDTTAAGDTFTGFFLASVAGELPLAEALDRATRAAAIAVSRKGATSSIPTMDEVLAFHPPV